MQWLAELCVKRPVFAAVLSLVILVVGVVFYSSWASTSFPKIDFPVIVVTTRAAGRLARGHRDRGHRQDRGRGQHHQRHRRAALDLHRGRVAGHRQFKLEKNVDVAAQEVRDQCRRRAARSAQGHRAAGRQQARPRRGAGPVRRAQRAGQRPIRDITELADRVVRRRLENVTGVGQVRIVGGRKRQINVWLDPVKLRGAGLIAGRGGSAPSSRRT